MSARLDYAFLAQFARVEPEGLLTVVAASFTRILTPSLPAQQQIFLVARLLFDEHAVAPVSFEATFRGPDGTFDINLGGDLQPGSDMVPVDGSTGAFLVLSPTIPLPSYGTYRAALALQDVEVQTMSFEVVSPPPAP